VLPLPFTRGEVGEVRTERGVSIHKSPLLTSNSLRFPLTCLNVLTFTMDAQDILDAEERLAEFFVLPLFVRESTWAEIAEDLVVALEPAPSLSLPAPITLRWPLLRT